MFTRVVELVSKQSKARELSSTINDKIVPILKKQAGFEDEIVLVSDADSNRVLALSFWKTREDAERYQRKQYKSVRETLESVLEAEPDPGCHCLKKGRNLGGTIAFRRNQAGSHTNST